MTSRAYEASSAQCALWRRKAAGATRDSRRVLLAHSDQSVGESLVVLLRLKTFEAQLAVDTSSTRAILERWNPNAVFLDTRIGGVGDGAFVREVCLREGSEHRLVIAMSSFMPEESVERLKTLGFDGHCRRPCPMWQMADILDGFFCFRAGD
jgi:DNA-binding NtrC family response regulator